MPAVQKCTSTGNSVASPLLARYFLLLFLASACAFSNIATATAEQKPDIKTSAQPADIEVFVREGCPHCASAEIFLATLKQQQPALNIVVRDVYKEPAALEQLKRIADSQGYTRLSVPTFKIGTQLIVGFSEEAGTAQLIGDSLTHKQYTPANIARCDTTTQLPCTADTQKSETAAVDFFGHRITLDQVGLPLFTLAMGLLDGFNPCSMWVLILMISLLAPLNNRPRMFAIAGTFIAVEGLAYFVFMAAWLNLFLLIGLSHASQIAIATLAILAGIINLKDFWAAGWGVSLSIPDAAKPGIYARIRKILQAENLTAAIFATVLLAILVQIVELMCTSGFPALYTRILTLKQLDSLSYYGYLLLYDLAYMFDDMIVLAIGIVTLSQRRLQKKEGRWLKLISGFVMVGLGVYLLSGK
jgi:glutaredoxin